MGRLSYDTSEKKLRREFEQYGPIKSVKMVLDNDGKPRGYAFIEFETETDMTLAFKQADGKKVDGRRILVDVERGRQDSHSLEHMTHTKLISLILAHSNIMINRTVRNWYPRRFGGGLGGRKPQKSKKEKEEEEKRAREAAASRSAYERPPARAPPRDDRGSRGGVGYGGGGRSRSRDRGGGDRGDRGGGDRGGPRRERSADRGSRGGAAGGGGDHYGPSASSGGDRSKRARSREREDDRGDERRRRRSRSGDRRR